MENEDILLRQLTQLHKLLIDVQKAEFEKQNQTKLENTSLLKLLMQDPGFLWLQTVSNIILQLQFAVEKKFHQKERFKTYIYGEITEIFFSPDSEGEFQKKYTSAIQSSEPVKTLHNEMKKIVDKLN